ncbi:MAG: dihydropteroate synthase [Simkaniaceae bacterium]
MLEKKEVRTQLMGVLNLTPISMSGPNPTLSAEDIHRIIVEMVNQGAEIIDVGGESTRPQAEPITLEEEWTRLAPFLENLHQILEDPRLLVRPVISIDTYHVETVRKLKDYPIDMINDVFGIEGEAIATVLSGTKIKYVLVHNKGRPGTNYMKEDKGVMEQLLHWFSDRIEQLLKLGLTKDQILLDPGIGFGKTPAQAAEILQNLEQIKALGYPLVIGHSRKASVMPSVKHLAPTERDLETARLSKLFSHQKVDMLRVHNCRINRVLLDAKISVLAAYQTDRGIGYKNRLPWDLKGDKQNFRKITWGHTIIMGRKTYESIGKPLEQRRNIVISKTLVPAPPGVEVYPSLQEALEHMNTKEEIFIIGGEKLFQEALPFADYLYLTLVQSSKPVDKFFPPFNEAEWELEQEVFILADECNEYPYTIKTLKRNW